MIITLSVIGAGLLMLLVERLRTGRSWPKVAGWWGRAIFLNSFQVAAVFAAGSLWNPWFNTHRLWSSESLGTLGGGIAGYVAITFVYYWWHRWRHQFNFLWRWFHQVHHSPQRIEIITSFYKHPFEIFMNGVLSSAILYLLVGVTPPAAALATVFSGLAELFYHWNVPTPYWLGFFFQRPESHCVHHQAGLHKYNYSDLPLWDMMFGTFKNPPNWKAKCGFGPKKEPRLNEMLAGKVIS
jgi:sterol desaturase/sphingolipid hydroxylase (fatty acid hydroxylase superfamily)